MLSQPLTKAIQTTEGVLIVVADVAVAVTSAIDPSALPHKYAALIVGAQNVALLVQRGILKGVALTTGLGVVPQPKPVLSQAKEDLTINAGVDAVEQLESSVKPDAEVAPAPVTPAATPAAPAQ